MIRFGAGPTAARRLARIVPGGCPRRIRWLAALARFSRWLLSPDLLAALAGFARWLLTPDLLTGCSCWIHSLAALTGYSRWLLAPDYLTGFTRWI
jgi:hypothetical protein